MRTIEQAEQVVAGAPVIYMPKGKEAPLCTGFLEEIGIRPPILDDSTLAGVDAEGRRYFRVRARDGVGLLTSGNGPEGAVALAGTDVAEEWGIGPEHLEYAEFVGAGEPTCTYELLVPKDATGSFMDRLFGDGDPLIVVTSLPNTLERAAQERDWNVRPPDFTPAGGVEIIAKLMIEQGQADAAADLVTSGGSAYRAGFWSSKSKELPPDYPIDPILRAVYGAVVWRGDAV